MRPERIGETKPAARRSKPHAAVREATIKLIRFRHQGEVHTAVWRAIRSISCRMGRLGSSGRGREWLLCAEVELLAPCEPSKVVAVGLNYRSHAQELSLQLPPAPLLFIKPSTAVVGPEASIVYPAMSERVDYEAELAVVIGKRASGLAPEEAAGYILGYTCGNDVTARDLQSQGRAVDAQQGFRHVLPIRAVDRHRPAPARQYQPVLPAERRAKAGRQYQRPDLRHNRRWSASSPRS